MFAGNVPTVNLPFAAEEVYPKMLTATTFQYWKTVSKTEVYSGTDWPSESTRWI